MRTMSENATVAVHTKFEAADDVSGGRFPVNLRVKPLLDLAGDQKVLDSTKDALAFMFKMCTASADYTNTTTAPRPKLALS